MDLDAILRLIRAAEATTFERLEISDADFVIKLERSAAGHMVPHGGTAVSHPEIGDETETDEPVIELKDTQEITSPLVGVFHQLPEGRAVKVGDKLKKGDIICMIEAMKLMNELVMPEDGEIVWVAAENDQMVEYGDLLYKYVKGA